MLIKNFKDINIGEIIKKIILEYEIDEDRICKHFQFTTNELKKIYNSKSFEAEVILKWSMFLEYDLFRIHTQHLILYSPPGRTSKTSEDKSKIPTFRKNIYTEELIAFIIETFEKGDKTIQEVITEYGIPKTTLYK